MKAFIVAATAGLMASSCFQTRPSVEAQKKKNTAFSPNEFRSYKLVKVQTETHDTKVYTFALPEKDMPLDFEVPSCITLRFVDEKGNEVMRPYTPLNLESDKGSFELMVKCYPHSKMGTHLQSMKTGETIQAKGPWRTMEITPSQYVHLGMLIGGTGITPAYQIARNFLSDTSNTTNISMVYCNKTKDDILLKDRLESLTRENPDKFAVFYMLTHAPERWIGYKGHITREIIEETMPSPLRKDSMVIVSGPPGFMKTVCGEKDGRNQGLVGGYLKEMGYGEKMVYKF